MDLLQMVLLLTNDFPRPRLSKLLSWRFGAEGSALWQMRATANDLLVSFAAAFLLEEFFDTCARLIESARDEAPRTIEGFALTLSQGNFIMAELLKEECVKKALAEVEVESDGKVQSFFGALVDQTLFQRSLETMLAPAVKPKEERRPRIAKSGPKHNE
eukprot:TRINITY_DN8750_c0_g2_i4.p1 TRINITY_DN8750_c0_g2~~TRINITY_DN8750_c0_g2_i4.p1  ORF type:complete len:159 (-),score=40.17 TRINITY_DN8750_c0_g2_i4:100-576(-)